MSEYAAGEDRPDTPDATDSETDGLYGQGEPDLDEQNPIGDPDAADEAESSTGAATADSER